MMIVELLDARIHRILYRPSLSESMPGIICPNKLLEKACISNHSVFLIGMNKPNIKRKSARAIEMLACADHKGSNSHSPSKTNLRDEVIDRNRENDAAGT
ncbi:hypothetical protein T310_3496 [Rasamsonia emersonii CBS 393.64]|uniref:Uncharacterized protein n=1 Tax=Rasamsonia emersonii (strain ATCC 16479 / CBS 393.64 / IMI 116815) TaxID=1408163 RepID=A0A0F4YXY7_RASE3|nr:hypothetical protein T310_3496 [Rasamsonia emersonii CBS 393.64]KKA22498.1 hypothetical protein T310_3496 [Rasamsonia emersonii CBS 393.64]